MPKYYRVNLRDKENNIIYPNVHNKWIFSSDGSLKIDSGSITLQNGNIYLNGNASGTPESTTKLVFGNNTTQYVILRANSEKSLVISDSLTDNTYSIEYNRNNAAFSSTTSGKISLGTVSRKWSSIYVNWGNFYGDIERVVNELDATLSNNNISSSIFPTTFCILDKNNRIVNRLECIPYSSGSIDSYWYLRNYKTDGTMVAQKGIRMSMNKSGTLTYSIADPANFRSAISAVSKAGDTLTGNLSYNMSGSTNIPFKVYGGDVNGQGISVGAGGATIIGSGESAKACESLLAATTEETWITSDGAIKFYTNCQTIENKVGVFLNNSRAFYPDIDGTGSLGTSTNKWNSIYSNSLTIQKLTNATVTYADKQNPRINFVNVDGTQAVSLIFTDYDSYKAPYGLTLVGNGQSSANGGAYLKVEGNIQASTMTATTFTGSLNGHASYPQGFNNKTGSQGWGNQDGTFVTGWSATGGSDIAFRANGGQLNVIIDGYYYCNEGKGRCTYSLDSSVRNMYASTIGTWNSHYSSYVNGTIMFCW